MKCTNTPTPINLEPRRPVLRWHGGKWKLAKWIISHFPEHRIYVEPFGGAGSVLLRKPRSYAEVYNDLDDEVVNFFQVLQSERQSALLRRRLYLTPYSREVFERAYEVSEDPIERALRLVVVSFMGFGSNAHNMANPTGFRANSKRSGTTPAHDWANYPDSLARAIDRLRGVVIENREAIKVMRQHDTLETLHYVDPPYVWETRTTSKMGKRGYRLEMDDNAHAELCSFLVSLQGMVVLSGYPNGLYDDLLRGWTKVSRETFADGANPRTEVLWLNPRASKGRFQ